MSAVVELRAGFRIVRAWMVDCGEWSPSEADEIGRAIKAAIDEQDAGYLAWWAEWMAFWAGIVEQDAAGREAIYQAALNQVRAERGVTCSH
jgi:hypothetical protein